MGYSLTCDAAHRLDRWTTACVEDSGSQNVFTVDGVRYFWAQRRVDYRDGGAGGTLLRISPDGRTATLAGRWRVDGDGAIVRAPGPLRRLDGRSARCR